MDPDLEAYQQLQRESEEAQQKLDQSEGALQQMKQELKEKFGVGSLQEAEKLYRQLQRKESEKKRAGQKALQLYQSKWRK